VPKKSKLQQTSPPTEQSPSAAQSSASWSPQLAAQEAPPKLPQQICPEQSSGPSQALEKPWQLSIATQELDWFSEQHS
jgi:hypothetical protein